MALVSRVKRHTYIDSLVLMRAATKAREKPGVIDLVILMGTPRNKEAIAGTKLLTDEVCSAGPNDLFFVVEAESQEIAKKVLDEVERLLLTPSSTQAELQEMGLTTVRSLQGALSIFPDANLVLISIPGSYVKEEALRALRRGLNLMIFSDNVPLQDEVMIKQTARELGLLVMGPDCGTALIAGTALGFANQIKRGPVGIVGASGTGIQEIACLVDLWGSGVSHAIGTGSNDVKAEVGGITMQAGIDLLLSDQSTETIVVISKPPAPSVQRVLLEKIGVSTKSVVVHLQGGNRNAVRGTRAKFAATLAEAAALAVECCGGCAKVEKDVQSRYVEYMQSARKSLNNEQTLIRGVFVGGTFCGEAAGIILQELGEVYTNIDYPGALPLPDYPSDFGHVCIDMGEDRFTRGRPHPMLEPAVCKQRILFETANPHVGVLLLDVVLGYGVHFDPAGALVPILKEAKERAGLQNRGLAIVAHVCGTDRDPQVRQKQVEKLRQAGVLVADTNAEAARIACRIAKWR